jgi:hypothetical protein
MLTSCYAFALNRKVEVSAAIYHLREIFSGATSFACRIVNISPGRNPCKHCDRILYCLNSRPEITHLEFYQNLYHHA